MPVKPSPEERAALSNWKQKGHSNAQIARTFGVIGGTIRYRLRRDADTAQDRRQNRPNCADPLAHVIDHVIKDHQARWAVGDTPRPTNVRALYDYLVTDHRYQG